MINAETCQGSCSLILASLCWFFAATIPWLSVVSGVCGTILGLYGVFRLIMWHFFKKDIGPRGGTR